MEFSIFWLTPQLWEKTIIVKLQVRSKVQVKVQSMVQVKVLTTNSKSGVKFSKERTWSDTIIKQATTTPPPHHQQTF